MLLQQVALMERSIIEDGIGIFIASWRSLPQGHPEFIASFACFRKSWR